MIDIDLLIELALNEDVGNGDHSSLATIPDDANDTAVLVAKEEGVIAGIEIAKKVFHKVNPKVIFTAHLLDGTIVKVGDKIFTVRGSARSILTAERLALNFIQRMSGIASRTRMICNLLSGLNTKVLDTRKTTPMLRQLEKEAVRIGGGENHRMGLYDMIMIKDNHIDFAGGIEKAIDQCRSYLEKNDLNLKVEIEVRDLNELDIVLNHGGVNRIMLDNFNLKDLKTAVGKIAGKYETEASGGITEDTIRNIAECGVDYISVGALTHHIRSLDLSLVADRT